MVLGLTGLWLLLNQSLALGHIVLGALLSVVLLWFTSGLRPLRARARRLDIAILLILVVIKDIAISNYNVARIVLGLTGRREIHSGFVGVPLELRDPHGLAVLAAIVTSTPGTVWAGLSESGDTLTLHVLDLKDQASLVRLIRDHYERPLMRIFE